MDAKTKRKVYSTAAGATDPILRKWAQKLATTTLPNSIFRHEYFESIVGALKGLMEAFASNMPPAAAVLLEKVTDFSDFFTGALGSQAEKVKAKVIEGWMDGFFKEAGWRLKKAKDPVAEAGRIKKEFELRQEILKVIEEAYKDTQPAAPPAEPTKWDWDMAWKKIMEIKEKIRSKAKEVASAIDKGAEKTAPHARNFRLWLERKGVR